MANQSQPRTPLPENNDFELKISTSPSPRFNRKQTNKNTVTGPPTLQIEIDINNFDELIQKSPNFSLHNQNFEEESTQPTKNDSA